jgi:hypothetical protein
MNRLLNRLASPEIGLFSSASDALDIASRTENYDLPSGRELIAYAKVLGRCQRKSKSYCMGNNAFRLHLTIPGQAKKFSDTIFSQLSKDYK